MIWIAVLMCVCDVCVLACVVYVCVCELCVWRVVYGEGEATGRCWREGGGGVLCMLCVRCCV